MKQPDLANIFSSKSPMTGQDVATLLGISEESLEANDETVPEDWPKCMSQNAFYGLAGDFVRLVVPESEADPHALLLCLLVGFGAMVGRNAYYQVESTRHWVNEFTVIAGATGSSRKGTAKDRAVNILTRVDPDFMKTQKKSGLSTGEGLIYAIRDERVEDVEVKDNSGPQKFERRIVDKGVLDKRLLAIETEFSSVLQASGRDGNILNSTLRDGWDGSPLSKLARSNKDSCQEPHVSIIGNITVEEVRQLLTTNDKANGFGNRFLWCCARRSKELAHGGDELDSAKLTQLVASLQLALKESKGRERICWDAESHEAWITAYHILTAGAEGLFGAMTARAASHVARLATLYALLDRSREIRMVHMRAAIAVWMYCEDSVRYIFGDALGDETADNILRMLQSAPDGLTQTEINRGFGSHKSGAEMTRALTLLEKRNKITFEQVKTNGAPVTRWKFNA